MSCSILGLAAVQRISWDRIDLRYLRTRSIPNMPRRMFFKLPELLRVFSPNRISKRRLNTSQGSESLVTGIFVNTVLIWSVAVASGMDLDNLGTKDARVATWEAKNVRSSWVSPAIEVNRETRIQMLSISILKYSLKLSRQCHRLQPSSSIQIHCERKVVTLVSGQLMEGIGNCRTRHEGHGSWKWNTKRPHVQKRSILRPPAVTEEQLYILSTYSMFTIYTPSGKCLIILPVLTTLPRHCQDNHYDRVLFSGLECITMYWHGLAFMKFKFQDHVNKWTLCCQSWQSWLLARPVRQFDVFLMQ